MHDKVWARTFPRPLSLPTVCLRSARQHCAISGGINLSARGQGQDAIRRASDVAPGPTKGARKGQADRTLVAVWAEVI